MGKEKDGGPAFPVTNDAKEGEMGMTLRDWFAGQAMLGCLMGEMRVELQEQNVQCEEVLKAVAESSYKIADAMLAARSKP